MADAVQLDHVAFGLRRIADGVPLVERELGGSKEAEMANGPFRWAQWRFRGGGVLELLEPDGPPGGFLHRFLEARGPGFHHVTFKVPSLADAAQRARRHGYEIVGYDDSDPGWKEAFLHPKQAQGIVVQLAQTTDVPRPPPRGDDVARIVALRISARDAAAARRQWCDVLGGSERPGADPGADLVFRWPGSPITVVAEVAPGREDGPLQLELSCPRPLGLPDGPHPALGARLVQVDEPREPGGPDDATLED
jgi:methylmalonyl-CoA/ethylmalonyl-CoA epimerase